MNTKALKKIRRRYKYYWRPSDLCLVLLDLETEKVIVPDFTDYKGNITIQEYSERRVKRILFNHINKSYTFYLALKQWKKINHVKF